MENDGDLNSSDIEFEEPARRNLWEAAGKESIESMLSRASEERIDSKKRVETLQFGKGAPKSQYKATVWWTRFAKYKEMALLKAYVSTQQATRCLAYCAF